MFQSKRLLLIFLFLIGTGLAAYLYVFHKPHRDLAAEAAQIEMNAQDFYQDYTADLQKANQTYNDQVIALKGLVSEKESAALVLEPGVYCSLDSTQSATSLESGQMVKLKGRVLSYDELFEQIKLDNVIILSADQ